MLIDVVSNQKSYFESGMQTVLRAQENRFRKVIMVKGALVDNTRSEESGVCAKVYNKGVNGFASMAEVSEEAARKVLKAASENANYLYKYAKKTKNPLTNYGTGYIESKRFIIDFEQKRMIDLCKEIDNYIVKTYPDLVSRTIVCKEDTMEKFICTSDAHDGHVAYPRVSLYVILSVESKNGQPVELGSFMGGFGHIEDNYSDLNKIYEEIDRTYKKVKDKAEGVYAEAGLKTVILDPNLSCMIAHEAVGHTVEADLVMGGSVAGPNLGKQVASELVSIVDFAHSYNDGQSPLPVYIDDEGIEAKDAVLVENGILKGYMHNRETADHFGVEPSGNARAWSFSDEPLIRMRNTIVLPGKDKLEDMIASVDDGYYLIDTGNGQADLTGEFMFGVTMGYEIKKGKLGRAILDTSASGIAFEMLKTVDMVSDEVITIDGGTCGKKQPMAVSMGAPAIRCQISIGGR